MIWMDVVAPLMVIGLIGEIFYFIISSAAVRGNQWRQSRMRPRRGIAGLGRLARRWWRTQVRIVNDWPYVHGSNRHSHPLRGT